MLNVSVGMAPHTCCTSCLRWAMLSVGARRLPSISLRSGDLAGQERRCTSCRAHSVSRALSCWKSEPHSVSRYGRCIGLTSRITTHSSMPSQWIKAAIGICTLFLPIQSSRCPRMATRWILPLVYGHVYGRHFVQARHVSHC